MLTLEHSFVKVLEKMSMINLMNYSLSTAAEGFVPSHAPLKNNKHLSIFFSQLSRGKEKNKTESQNLTALFRVHAYGTKGGGLGSCLHFVSNF